mmetsp:Transcript_5547/g.13690  ORF Transcript_5547/g.13690 Transcript_5547/m.13690 type:complete len:665 (+) Transcript_5547:102-2096(+)
MSDMSGDQDGNGFFRGKIYYEEDDYEQAAKPTPTQLYLFHWLRHPTVDTALTFIITSNLGLIIIESDNQAAGVERTSWMETLSYVLLAIYTIELVVRLYVFRMHFFTECFNVLDLSIILLDYMMLILSAVVDNMLSIGFLRVIRLARLARSIKVIMKFPQLALMVKGLIGATQVILWGAVLLMGSLTIFGIFATQLLHPINVRVAERGIYQGCERCPRAFESVFQSMLTFWQQIITGDSWGTVSLPIIEEEPMTVLFFVGIYLYTTMIMLNVILAVVVDSSQQASSEDAKLLLRQQEREFHKQAKQFTRMCQELDVDKSGSLTKAELMQAFDTNPKFQEFMQVLQIQKDDCNAVFGILDKDGSGDVAYSEFVEEIHKMKTHDAHTILIFIKYYVCEIRKVTDRMDALRRVGTKARTSDYVQFGTENTLGTNSGVEAKAVWNRDDLFFSNPLAPKEAEGSLRECLWQVQRTLSEDIARCWQDIIQRSDAQLQLLSLQPGPANNAARPQQVWPARSVSNLSMNSSTFRAPSAATPLTAQSGGPRQPFVPPRPPDPQQKPQPQLPKEKDNTIHCCPVQKASRSEAMIGPPPMSAYVRAGTGLSGPLPPPPEVVPANVTGASIIPTQPPLGVGLASAQPSVGVGAPAQPPRAVGMTYAQQPPGGLSSA